MDIAICTSVGDKKQIVWNSAPNGCSTEPARVLPVYRAIKGRILSNRANVIHASSGMSALTASSVTNFMKQIPFGQSLGGSTLVHGGDVKLRRPLQVEYTQPRAPGSRAKYEHARRTGGIYIAPDERYMCSVQDVPVVIDYASSRETTHHAWFPDMAPPPTQYACNRQLYDGGGVDIDITIPHNTVNNLVPLTRYRVYKDAEVKSGLDVYSSELRSFVNAVVDTIRTTDISTSLVTSGTAELNSAYWDIATEIGELPETVKMIYGGVKAILTKYLEARKKIATLKKNSLSSGSLITDTASIWMAYRYGIMPIVYSINDALDYLNAQGVFRTVRQGENFSVPVWHGGNQYMITGRDRYWGKARVDPFDAKTGLKMNLMSTAWELIPLSFVIDWAFNVGDLLSSLKSPSGAREVKHSYSRRVSASVDYIIDGTPFIVDFEYYHRQPINPLGHIGLSSELTLTWKRVIDALALSWFAFKKDYRGNSR